MCSAAVSYRDRGRRPDSNRRSHSRILPLNYSDKINKERDSNSLCHPAGWHLSLSYPNRKRDYCRCGGRYWTRTSGLVDVNHALYPTELIASGAEGQSRTGDARLFRATLYH